MKLNKMMKVVSFVLAVSILSIGITSAQEENKAAVDEITVAKLTALGVIENSGTKDISATVTKSEFAKIITKFLNLSDASDNAAETTPFIDVELNNPALGDIKLLSKMGYISGDGNKRYFPDSEITYNQAISVIVSAMGYKNQAAIKGGYPYGYFAVAAENQMLDGIKAGGDNAITLAEIYKILDNCTEVDICTQTGFGETAEYSIIKDNTPLKAFHKISKLKGVVTANQYTGLSTPESKTQAGQIQIDSNNYFTDADYSKLLGMSVDYFVSEDSNKDYKVKYLQPALNKNTELKIASVDIASVEAQSVRYLVAGSDKEKTMRISDDADVIYNGRALSGYGTIQNVIPGASEITGLDRDNDEEIDVLFITSYTNIVVRGIDKDSRIVYDKYTNQGMGLDENLYDVEIFGVDGKPVKIKEIKEWDILTVAQSKNTIGRILKRVYISRNIVTGEVSEITSDKDVEYKIAGANYKMASNYADAAAEGSAQNITVRKYGSFYLDYEGKIAAYRNSTKGDLKYAVVAASGQITGINTIIQLKLYTQDDEFIVADCADKVSLNGSVRSSAFDKESIKQAVIPGEVIRFRQKDDGTIDYIDTAETDVSEGLRTLKSGSTIRFRNNIINGEFAVTADTIMFSKPTDLTDEEGYGRLKTSSFSSGSDLKHNFTAYDVCETNVNIAAALVVENISNGGISTNTQMGIVTKVVGAVNDDEEPTKKIFGVIGNSEMEIITETADLISTYNIQPGDIIRIGTNNKGEAFKFEKVYNAGGAAGSGSGAAVLVPGTKVTNTSVFDADYRVLYADVNDIENGYVRFITSTDTTTSSGIFSLSGASIVKYDRLKNEAKNIKSDELIVGDKIIIRLNLAIAKEIIVLR